MRRDDGRPSGTAAGQAARRHQGFGGWLSVRDLPVLGGKFSAGRGVLDDMLAF
jgi:hypothetical protein